MMKDSLGDRMKRYEKVFDQRLSIKTPVILFLDGKAFHTFTRGLKKPFDDILMQTMIDTLIYLCENIQNAKFGYTQSDEISILLTDWDNFETSQWYDYRIQKIVSVAAAMATEVFNRKWKENLWESNKSIIDTHLTRRALFDCRAFNLPLHEVENWFIWRQQDWIRNSIQMLARSYFSHKKLHKKNRNDMLTMLRKEYGVEWEFMQPKYKYGTIYSNKSKLGSFIFKDNRQVFKSALEVDRL